jgi:hypothetical protein
MEEAVVGGAAFVGVSPRTFVARIRVAPVAIPRRRRVRDEVESGQHAARKVRMRQDAGVDDGNDNACGIGLRRPGRFGVHPGQRITERPLLRVERIVRRGLGERALDRIGVLDRAVLLQDFGQTCQLRRRLGLENAQHPNVGDLPFDGKRGADACFEARQQFRPIRGGVVLEANHEATARCRGGGREHLRGLEARRGDSRGFGPQHAAVVAQRLQRGCHGGVVLRLRQRQVERARARRAGQRQSGPDQHFELGQCAGRQCPRGGQVRMQPYADRRHHLRRHRQRGGEQHCQHGRENGQFRCAKMHAQISRGCDQRVCGWTASSKSSANRAETGRRMTGGYAGAPCPGQKPDSGGRPLGGFATATPCLATSQPFAALTAAARSCSMACRNGASVVTICAKIFGLPAITWPPCR